MHQEVSDNNETSEAKRRESQTQGNGGNISASRAKIALY
jgi:hypothetical protein